LPFASLRAAASSAAAADGDAAPPLAPAILALSRHPSSCAAASSYVAKEADWHTSHVHRCTCLTVTTALLKAFGGGAGVGASLFAASMVSLATDWTDFSRLGLSLSSSVPFDILAACSSGWEAPWKSLSLSLRPPVLTLLPAMVEDPGIGFIKRYSLMILAVGPKVTRIPSKIKDTRILWEAPSRPSRRKILLSPISARRPHK
jgi:hypothetical protein